jgi:hypothetical protein
MEKTHVQFKPKGKRRCLLLSGASLPVDSYPIAGPHRTTISHCFLPVCRCQHEYKDTCHELDDERDGCAKEGRCKRKETRSATLCGRNETVQPPTQRAAVLYSTLARCTILLFTALREPSVLLCSTRHALTLLHILNVYVCDTFR